MKNENKFDKVAEVYEKFKEDDEKFAEYKNCFKEIFAKYNKDGIITVANDMYGYLGNL